jgi:hypothetical protein
MCHAKATISIWLAKMPLNRATQNRMKAWWRHKSFKDGLASS